MHVRKVAKAMGISFGVVACWLALASTASAGPILDWLFPGLAARREARRMAWSTPGVTTYHVPVTSYYGTYPAWNNGAVTAATASYTPTTAYRTVWAPVPVTSYSPVTYVNPLAGGTVSDVQACTSYSWQARRVPYISYTPVAPAATIAPTVGQVSYAIPSSVTTHYGNAVSYSMPTTVAAPAATTYTAPATTYAPAPTTYGPMTSPSDCGYVNGNAFAPSAPPQTYAAPQSGTTIYGDSYTAPPARSGQPNGTEPADQPPTLQRPLSGSYDTESRPSNGQPNTGNSPQYTPPTDDFGRRMIPIPDVSANGNPPLPLRMDSGAASATPTARAPSDAPNFEYVKPIPEYERQRRAWEMQRVPRLRETEDHMAATTPRELPKFTAWEAVPVRWAVVTADDQRRSTVVPIGVEVAPSSDRGPTIAPVHANENVWRPSSQ